MEPRPAIHDPREPSGPRNAAPIRRAHAARDLVLPLRRAVELHLRGDYAAAERRLRAVLELDPLLPQAHHHLAVVLHAQGRTVEALRHLREAVHRDPHLPGAKERLERYVAEAHAERD
ncbi:MAG: tetratricopeptide repeat protein [Planctomycetota bacterium]